MILVDTAGRITYWNSDAETLLGHPAGDALGASVDLVIPQAHRDAHWAGFGAAMREPAPRDLAADLPFLRADGCVRELAARLVILTDPSGRTAGAAAIITDEGTTGRHPSR